MDRTANHNALRQQNKSTQIIWSLVGEQHSFLLGQKNDRHSSYIKTTSLLSHRNLQASFSSSVELYSDIRVRFWCAEGRQKS